MQSCREQIALDAPFGRYAFGSAFDEMFGRGEGPRPAYEGLYARLQAMPTAELKARKQAADLSFLQQGVTFTVYGASGAAEHILPHDLLPRILAASEWERLARGLEQRVRALNAFLHDIYHEERILRDKVELRDLVYSCPHYLRQMRGVDVPGGVYIHVTGADCIRTESGAFAVLEDNLRVPSGVSYMLANRAITKRVLPQLLRHQGVRPVDQYPQQLLQTLRDVAPAGVQDANVVVLTPGVFNAAYYEHALLAREMGVELIEGRDLLVHDSHVYMRSTAGLKRVDVIYRRLDDGFLDPLNFHPDSKLGVPGLFHAYRSGKVTLANAPGTGVADDKAIYAWVPEIIRYYLDEEALLPNIETYLCADDKQRRHVLSQLHRMVVKAVGSAGGYGMLIGPHASPTERDTFAARIEAEPRGYIAQPTIHLSQAPCFIDDAVVPRHVDLRPFILFGQKVMIPPGGLTRVALRQGSLVVNSSQGGGSKDTWVLRA